MVATQSSMLIPPATIVEMIFDVRVERMFAFTPLPSPSASTMTSSSSFGETHCTRSPQSVSPSLFRL